MKIRHPWLLNVLAFFAAWCIRVWNWTLRYDHRPAGADFTPHQPRLPGRFIYAFWHEDMVVPAYQYARPDVHVLISQHADGRLIAKAITWLGLKVVAGSTTRGSAAALLKMLQIARESHIVITPDGPRGPRRRVQPGIAFVAARTGLPIVAVGFGYARTWRTKSWDQMALPRPFSRVVCVTMPPIHVPDVEDKDQLEEYRQQVEHAMRDASRRAQEAAMGAAVIAPAVEQIDPRDRAA